MAAKQVTIVWVKDQDSENAILGVYDSDNAATRAIDIARKPCSECGQKVTLYNKSSFSKQSYIVQY